jgi:tetratricopeptide (TPR) repeat protein
MNTLEHAGLSLETLARLLAGRPEHEELLRVVVPHLLALCPDCRQMHAEIRRLQEKMRHWDEEVVVAESRSAPELLARLETWSFEEQSAAVESSDELHTWGLCQLLLDKSQTALFRDPIRGLELADLAAQVADHLGEAYDPHWVWDLRAKAHSYVGNARRALGELRSSDAAFRKSEQCLAKSMTGNLEIEAEIRLLQSSLRRDQLQFAEALAFVEKAVVLYREKADPTGVATALLKKAKILEEAGDLKTAIALLEESLGVIRGAPDGRLFACARFNLLACLALAGRFEEAHAMLAESRALFAESAQPLDLTRLRWAESKILHGLGALEEAELAFREVQREFLARHCAYDAAVVSLDLAALFAQQGRTQELKVLAMEIMPVFESGEIHREAMACLIMFQHACDEERLTVELARQLAAFLRREKRGSRILGT